VDQRPVFVFVHSPLVGPLSFQPVADLLAAGGERVAVADLTGAMAGPPPYQPRIADAVAEAAEPAGAPTVLIGHSGAGPLLPGVAARLAVPVRALVYVDAGLPYPGHSWFETAPPDLVARLRGLTAGDRLPPWHTWFPADVLDTLLPEPALRERFTSQLGPLPLDYFREPTPPQGWSGPAGYLLLSEAYREDATRAAGAGVPVLERISHHLAMLTSPEVVAGAVRDLLAAAEVP
jgi:pimeloyl-ACP methyl ester carboxylesterase